MRAGLTSAPSLGGASTTASTGRMPVSFVIVSGGEKVGRREKSGEEEGEEWGGGGR